MMFMACSSEFKGVDFVCPNHQGIYCIFYFHSGCGGLGKRSLGQSHFPFQYTWAKTCLIQD